MVDTGAWELLIGEAKIAERASALGSLPQLRKLYLAATPESLHNNDFDAIGRLSCLEVLFLKVEPAGPAPPWANNAQSYQALNSMVVSLVPQRLSILCSQWILDRLSLDSLIRMVGISSSSSIQEWALMILRGLLPTEQHTDWILEDLQHEDCPFGVQQLLEQLNCSQLEGGQRLLGVRDTERRGKIAELVLMLIQEGLAEPWPYLRETQPVLDSIVQNALDSEKV